MQAEKLQLVKMLIDTEDRSIISKIKAIFQSSDEADFWDEMPEEIQVSLDRSLNQSARKETTPHEVVMKKYDKWLSR